jgi:hypothetical protein
MGIVGHDVGKCLRVKGEAGEGGSRAVMAEMREWYKIKVGREESVLTGRGSAPVKYSWVGFLHCEYVQAGIEV